MSRPAFPRWSVAIPGPRATPGALAAIGQAGAGCLLDFHAPVAGQVREAAGRLAGRLTIRLFEPSAEALAEVVGQGPRWERVFLEVPVALGEEARLLAAARIPLGLVVTGPADLFRLRARFPGADSAAGTGSAAGANPSAGAGRPGPQGWGNPGLDDGWPVIARGNEAGGFVGPLGTFVLFQLMARRWRRPFLLEGGLGWSGAVAAVREGAAGVVFGAAVHPLLGAAPWLDDLLLGAEPREPFLVTDRRGRGFRFLTPTPLNPTDARRLIADEEPRDWPAVLPAGLLPCGQDLTLAPGLLRRFGALGDLVQDISRMVEPDSSPDGVWSCVPETPSPSGAREGILSCVPEIPDGSGLGRFAAALGGGRGIIQGPMARISESVAFLRVVAEAGGVPVLAFGSRDGEECRRLLREARSAGVRVGVGVIGLDLQRDLVERQRAVLREMPPWFVLVAAPRPDLVAALLADGHLVLAHAFEPRLFAALAETGCRWFILEGGESGGHIGRLSSLVLWQRILEDLPTLDPGGQARLVFAGGIASREGARFVARLVEAQGLAGRLDWAMQLGTAYLATREIVETGAMGRNYRNQVINGEETRVTGETVKLRARQVATPFVDRILAREEDWLREELPLPRRRDLFEQENMGNLARAVSSPEGEDGCFLAGEAVALTKEVTTIAEVHDRLVGWGSEGPAVGERPAVTAAPTRGSRREIGIGETPGEPMAVIPTRPGRRHDGGPAEAFPGQARGGCDGAPAEVGPGHASAGRADGAPIEAGPGQTPGGPWPRLEPIAIIGVGCVFPGSPDPAAYFRNIVQGRCFVQTLPTDRLDPEIWYDPDRTAPVGTYTRVGAWVDGFVFDPVPFRIPPRVAARLDLTQRFALVAARQALDSAGLLTRAFDRERAAVIVGNSMGGAASVDNLRAIHLHEFLAAGRRAGLLPDDPDLIRRYRELIGPAPITEDSLPGELSSLVAGRINAVFDLHGPNFTIDAACGSGLAAVIAGVNALHLGQVDLVVAGGADTQMDPGSFVKFAKVTALSATGSFPFDARGDGFVMGEGAGMVVLKRLSDARRDGDPVLALLLGVGQSSDGRGKGITAPNPDGQRRALARAWADAGRDPRAAAFFEAHGTGTVVGDTIELNTLAGFLREAGGGKAGPAGLLSEIARPSDRPPSGSPSPGGFLAADHDPPWASKDLPGPATTGEAPAALPALPA
ncbi:MAG: hypothetical protein GX442_21800, partial [Candidatus Riflebacteria bacterium]|nr:hypothetical protein [Candidatus Riflebacteria bacterium]